MILSLGGYNHYNPSTRYLPICEKSSIHKCCIDKHLTTYRKWCNSFNDLPHAPAPANG